MARLPTEARSTRSLPREDRQAPRNQPRPERKKQLRKLKQSRPPSPCRPSNRPMKKFESARISLRNAGNVSTCPATRIRTGSKQNVSSCPKSAPADAAFSYGIDSNPGTHPFALSRRRFIANGLAISPATPGSFKSSWARSSSAFPETSNNGGTSRGGCALL